MTQDSEFSLIEKDLEGLIESFDKVKHLVSEDTLSPLIKGMDYLLEIAVEMRKDYKDCQNDGKKDFLISEFKKMLNNIKEANNVLMRALNDRI